MFKWLAVAAVSPLIVATAAHAQSSQRNVRGATMRPELLDLEVARWISGCRMKSARTPTPTRP